MADRKANLFARLTVALAVASLFFFLMPEIQLANAITVTYAIDQGSDDCYKKWNGAAWEFSLTNLDNDAGYFSAWIYKTGGGYRFNNIAVPQGAVITSAYMQFYLVYYGTNFTLPCNNMLRGEDADNAATFANVTEFDARTR